MEMPENTGRNYWVALNCVVERFVVTIASSSFLMALYLILHHAGWFVCTSHIMELKIEVFCYFEFIIGPVEKAGHA